MDGGARPTAWGAPVEDPPVEPPSARRCSTGLQAALQVEAALGGSDELRPEVRHILEGVQEMLRHTEDRLLDMEDRVAERILEALHTTASVWRVPLPSLPTDVPRDSETSSVFSGESEAEVASPEPCLRPSVLPIRESSLGQASAPMRESCLGQTSGPPVDLSSIDFEREDSYLHATAKRVARRAALSSGSSRVDALASCASRLVKHPYFEVTIGIAIVTNAMFIGYQIDAVPSAETKQIALAINSTYALVFVVELLLRMWGYGLRQMFCTGKLSVGWAYLDLLFVCASLVEVAMDVLGYLAYSPGETDVEGHSSIAANFRVLRVVRCTRVIRCIRLAWLIRFVRSLRILVHQIVACSKSLIWAMFLLAMIIYLFALVFTQAVHAHLGAGRPHEEVLGDPLGFNWYTVPRSMSTLFQAITGGVSWREVVIPLSSVGGIWVAVFVLYICFTQMAVLNLLVGAFCQNAVDSARHDQDLVAQSVLAERKMYNKQFVSIFAAIDRNASGSINLDDFRQHLNDDSMQALFNSFGIDASDAWSVFKLLDADHDGVVKLDEFMGEFSRLRGNASALDLALLHNEHKSITKRLSRFMKRTDGVMKHLCTALNVRASCAP